MFWYRRTTSSSGSKERSRAPKRSVRSRLPHMMKKKIAPKVSPSPTLMKKSVEKTLDRPTEENHISSVHSTARFRRERNPTRTTTTMIPIQNRRESRPRRRGRGGTSVELRTRSSLRLSYTGITVQAQPACSGGYGEPLGKFSPARRSPASESWAHKSHGASLGTAKNRIERPLEAVTTPR